MPVKTVLGRIEYQPAVITDQMQKYLKELGIDVDVKPLEITKLKRTLLKLFGVSRADISNYKARRFLYINKRKYKIMKSIIENTEVLNADDFKPFNQQKLKGYVIAVIR